MLKVAIIEDEIPAIHRLTNMLDSIGMDIQIEAIARTGKEAIELCRSKQPQLVFLDIHLPDMKGFRVIEALNYSPYVIFTTAYANYAIRAFQTWAVDYLLKPFDEEQLSKAINKYISIVSRGDKNNDINWDSLSQLFENEKKRTSLTVKNGGRIQLVDFVDIAYVQAEDKYCKIYTMKGKQIFCDNSLKETEVQLNESFLRVHRSTIINIASISEARKTFKGRFVFYFDSEKVSPVRSGASYKERIIDALNL